MQYKTLNWRPTPQCGAAHSGQAGVRWLCSTAAPGVGPGVSYLQSSTQAQQHADQQQTRVARALVARVAANRREVLTGMLGTTALTITPPPAAAQNHDATPRPTDCDTRSNILSPDSYTTGRSNGDNAFDDCRARGAAAARDPAINSGCATPAGVRQQQQLAGLLPPRQVDLQVEVLRAQAALENCSTPLEKHRLLVTLKETNQAAFYMLLQQDLETLLPLVYTPTIGDACLNWGVLLPRPTGLYVSLRDRGSVAALLRHWPSDEVRVAVITDGERILGLGDLGAHGMGIPTGKCVVYGAAGANPDWLLPITVDVGTNNRQLQGDPLYVGLPQGRVRGQAYADLLMELVLGLQDRFARRVLVHWEDLAARNAFEMLQLVRKVGVPTFNDDIQATAAVALAAILGGVRVPGALPLTQQTWLFFGAGQANLGTAQLLVKALQKQGLSAQGAKSRIWMVDSKGLILKTRQNLTPEKAVFAQDPYNLAGGMAAAEELEVGNTDRQHSRGPGSSSSSSSDSSDQVFLANAVLAVQPTALIGAAAVAGAFGQTVIKALVQSTKTAGGPSARPLVLALSNPTSKAEVSYADAMRWSNNRTIYASGSPFPPLHTAATTGDSRDGGSNNSKHVLRPGQANNCLVFPGLGLGVVQSGAATVTDELLLSAAQAVADSVTAAELLEECILPGVGRLQEVAAAVQQAVVAAARARPFAV